MTKNPTINSKIFLICYSNVNAIQHLCKSLYNNKTKKVITFIQNVIYLTDEQLLFNSILITGIPCLKITQSNNNIESMHF